MCHNGKVISYSSPSDLVSKLPLLKLATFVESSQHSKRSRDEDEDDVHDKEKGVSSEFEARLDGLDARVPELRHEMTRGTEIRAGI